MLYIEIIDILYIYCVCVCVSKYTYKVRGKLLGVGSQL